MKCSFTPYEGNDPYIFVSYSHKDSDKVFPVLEQLNNQGFRVWYDEGIEWGSEWPESIGAHLHNSAVCMFFHSEDSVKSRNCRQELYYANQEEKNLFSVYLEDVKLNYGLDMQLSPFQATFLYQYNDIDKFYENLFKTEILKNCCGEMLGTNNATHFNNNTSVYSIPDGTVKIKNEEFFGHDTIKQLHIPDSVEIVGKSAFSNALIEKIIGMNGVKKIAAYAFARSKFENIQIKAPLQEIGAYAFANTKLNEAEIPNSVIKMSKRSFSGSSVKKVIINGNIKKIPDYAFGDCYELESVRIQTKIMKIGRAAFSGCYNLREISIPYGLTHIEKRAFSTCGAIKEISIPDTVQYIGDNAFAWCSSLECITIPNHVKYIGKNAFQGTENLRKISMPRCLEKYVPSLGLKGDFQELKPEKYRYRQLILINNDINI